MFIEAIEKAQEKIQEEMSKLQSQLDNLIGLEEAIEEKVQDSAYEIAEAKRNMVMDAIVEIEDMLNEAGIDEDDIYEIQGDLHDAIEEAAMYV